MGIKNDTKYLFLGGGKKDNSLVVNFSLFAIPFLVRNEIYSMGIL